MPVYPRRPSGNMQHEEASRIACFLGETLKPRKESIGTLEFSSAEGSITILPWESRCNIWQGKFPYDNSAEDGFKWVAPVDSFGPQNKYVSGGEHHYSTLIHLKQIQPLQHGWECMGMGWHRLVRPKTPRSFLSPTCKH